MPPFGGTWLLKWILWILLEASYIDERHRWVRAGGLFELGGRAIFPLGVGSNFQDLGGVLTEHQPPPCAHLWIERFLTVLSTCPVWCQGSPCFYLASSAFSRMSSTALPLTTSLWMAPLKPDTMPDERLTEEEYLEKIEKFMADLCAFDAMRRTGTSSFHKIQAHNSFSPCSCAKI